MKDLVDIATYLSQQGCGHVAGPEKTIFVNHMPADVRKGILIRQDYTGIPIDVELPGYCMAAFQVIVRSPDHVEGETLAEKVSVILNKERVAIGSLRMKYIRPTQKPFVFPPSDGDFLEFLVLFDACYTTT